MLVLVFIVLSMRALSHLCRIHQPLMLYCGKYVPTRLPLLVCTCPHLPKMSYMEEFPDSLPPVLVISHWPPRSASISTVFCPVLCLGKWTPLDYFTQAPLLICAISLGQWEVEGGGWKAEGERTGSFVPLLIYFSMTLVVAASLYLHSSCYETDNWNQITLLPTLALSALWRS